MSQTSDQPNARLWFAGSFINDEFSSPQSAEELGDAGHAIVPLDVFLGLDAEERRAANRRIGVSLKPGEPVEKIAEFLSELSVVALEFPAFNDGRSFSKAEILRRRYAYEGRIRAIGQVLPDQISHMLRVGFDELLTSHPVSLKWLEQGRTAGLGLSSQPSARGDKRGQKYSWRRRPAA